MKITILGTGAVGQTIAARLFELGHEVIMGTRDPKETQKRESPNQITGKSFAEWYQDHSGIKLLPFKAASTFTDLVINATNGAATLDILSEIGASNLEGKILLDLANPLDFSKGFPPSLFVCNTDSLGEQVQKKLPKTKVVKGLNTMNAYIMMHPHKITGDHHLFLSGNDQEAKNSIIKLLLEIGWKNKNIIDLGDISTARATEMLLPVWLRLYKTLGHTNFNFHIQGA
ncbi:NAD(P)-binding domain-containing protein [Echinicola jeungdonensis]|uniref:NADPH-dependent F420 reductase n=1 Tax=Echinicola jeungdonensis TaxID=709343 RepID=A0ABV5J2Z3_9BACT|nr:NAD(P)-binding domain-containing protein [Echinicola jeungdonensis]MDN3670558.1 NAD(P)-binding domain-containing protein [Echinicola jeungdonensis]